ncbi:hypothetical protein QDD82_000012 [Burkholderia cepacia]|uniref:hypothetical protein n=1 Tax=Burkholderia cepacia complex TaxID=87882 RepID=UPI00158E4E4E|nr:hypothetical protein [Burkholderia cenocepacia]EKS9839257.1 hypothetical protein [Burkholderia cepacia]
MADIRPMGIVFTTPLQLSIATKEVVHELPFVVCAGVRNTQTTWLKSISALPASLGKTHL